MKRFCEFFGGEYNDAYHFKSIGLSGPKNALYNVIVTIYKTFIQDYLHLCQIPFQAVILDDGMSWLGTAHYDPNGQFGKVFDKGIWNQSDNHAGLAIVGYYDEWDFSLDVNSYYDNIEKETGKQEQQPQEQKKALIGLST